MIEVALLPEVHRPALDGARAQGLDEHALARRVGLQQLDGLPERAAWRQRRPDAQDEPANRLARHRRQRRQRGHLHRPRARADRPTPETAPRATPRRQAPPGRSRRRGGPHRSPDRPQGPAPWSRPPTPSGPSPSFAMPSRASDARRTPVSGPCASASRSARLRVEHTGVGAAHAAAHALERGRLPPRVARRAARHGRDQGRPRDPVRAWRRRPIRPA